MIPLISHPTHISPIFLPVRAPQASPTPPPLTTMSSSAVLGASAASFTLGARLTSGRSAKSSRASRRSFVTRAAQTDEAAILAKYPDGGPVFAVSIDCHMGTNSTGIVMREGDEGRPVVSAVRPGGTAKNKLKVGDVCLATTYTELVQDPDNKTLKWGTPVVGWFDTEGENYASSIAAMETNSATLNMIMFRPE